MNPDQVRALAIVAALWTAATNSASFVGGRMTAPVPPPEVRLVHVPAPAVPLPAEAVPVEPAQPAPALVEPIEAKPAAPAPQVEAKPLPPKVDAKPKPKIKPQAKPEAKPRAAAPKKSLPSCAVVKREYETMSWTQQMAAYRRATAEEVAHGKRCLGL